MQFSGNGAGEVDELFPPVHKTAALQTVAYRAGGKWRTTGVSARTRHHLFRTVAATDMRSDRMRREHGGTANLYCR